MNKKADAGEILKDNVVFLIVLAIIALGTYLVIAQQTNGAAIWEEYYAKEIAKAINSAQSNDEIEINVQQATKIALKNKITDPKEMFNIDNPSNKICVKLSKGRQTCYSYFNDVEAIFPPDRIKYGLGENEDNVLVLQIKESPKNEPQ